MTEVNGFDFSKYDVGGSDATAGDGRLTGGEVKQAMADGWNVWDEFRKGDEASRIDKSSEDSKWKSAIQKMKNMSKSETYQKYRKKYDEILERKMAEFGVCPTKHEGYNIYNIDTILFDPNYKQACKEAEKEAKEELGLSPNAFRGGILGGFFGL